MKKNVFGLVTLAMCMISPLAMAQLPHTNTFETMDFNGQSIITNTRPAEYSTWSGSYDGIAVVTNVTYSNSLNTAYMGTPVPPPGAGVLYFSRTPLTNSLDGTGNTLVGIDMMVLPTFKYAIEADEATSNSQFSLTFTTNGYPAVYHGTLTPGVETAYPDAKGWSEISDMPKISSGKWVRVSIDINYLATSTWGNSVMFKVRFDGITVTNANAYSDASVDASLGGPWFLAAAWGSMNMSRIVLNGTGWMDDLLVGTSAIGNYVTTNQIPYNWFVVTGITNDTSDAIMNALASTSEDADSDGMPNWAEYLAGTQPTNFYSKLVIVSQSISNGVPTIQWLGTTAALADYTIAASTNLLDANGWTNLATKVREEGTNTLQLIGIPAVSPGFLRVMVVK